MISTFDVFLLENDDSYYMKLANELVRSMRGLDLMRDVGIMEHSKFVEKEAKDKLVVIKTMLDALLNPDQSIENEFSVYTSNIVVEIDDAQPRSTDSVNFYLYNYPSKGYSVLFDILLSDYNYVVVKVLKEISNQTSYGYDEYSRMIDTERMLFTKDNEMMIKIGAAIFRRFIGSSGSNDTPDYKKYLIEWKQLFVDNKKSLDELSDDLFYPHRGVRLTNDLNIT